MSPYDPLDSERHRRNRDEGPDLFEYQNGVDTPCPFYDNHVEYSHTIERGAWIPRHVETLAASSAEVASYLTWKHMLVDREQLKALKYVVSAQVCPMCGAGKPVYHRRLYYPHVVFLLALALATEATGEEWHHVHSLPKQRGGEFAKSVYWGLAYPRHKESRDTQQTESGVWRISPTGTAFVKGALRIPAYAYTGGVRASGGVWVLAYSRAFTTAAEALGISFDFRDLIGLSPSARRQWLDDARDRSNSGTTPEVIGE